MPLQMRFHLDSSWWWRIVGTICLLSILINLAALRQNYHGPHHRHRPGHRPGPPPIILTNGNSTSWDSHHANGFEKPKDFRVVGLIFAGRRDRLSILDCYLQRNLVHNGGFLDEVIFLQRTAIPEDVAYITGLVSQVPGYTLVDPHQTRWGDYSHSWDVCEAGTMYIKIDDDIVYIEDTTIPAIVKRKLEEPNTLLVSANSLNQAGLAWLHERIGAVLPYLPELEPIPHPNPRPKYDWRASMLPSWEGPEDFEIQIGQFKPPFHGHRWLPVRDRYNTDNTPIRTTEFALETSGVKSWAVGAQQHYSFLEHLEKGELWRYQFSTWDYNYMRLSITFIAIWGDDVVPFRKDIGTDDEEFFTVDLPKKLKRHVIVDGTGLAVHFAFYTQWNMDDTDLLERYRAYAEENICVR